MRSGEREGGRERTGKGAYTYVLRIHRVDGGVGENQQIQAELQFTDLGKAAGTGGAPFGYSLAIAVVRSCYLKRYPRLTGEQ